MCIKHTLSRVTLTTETIHGYRAMNYDQTERTRLRLYHDLGTFERDAILAIIDEAPMCSVSVVVDGGPYIQPTVHWRDGDKLFVHGAVKNKMVNAVRNGADACISFAHFDGFILPRSGFNHAVLYRSATLFSIGRFLEDPDEKELRLRQFVEHIQPGRWETIRPPTSNELTQTGIIEFEINEISGIQFGHRQGATAQYVTVGIENYP